MLAGTHHTIRTDARPSARSTRAQGTHAAIMEGGGSRNSSATQPLTSKAELSSVAVDQGETATGSPPFLNLAVMIGCVLDGATSRAADPSGTAHVAIQVHKSIRHQEPAHTLNRDHSTAKHSITAFCYTTPVQRNIHPPPDTCFGFRRQIPNQPLNFRFLVPAPEVHAERVQHRWLQLNMQCNPTSTLVIGPRFLFAPSNQPPDVMKLAGRDHNGRQIAFNDPENWHGARIRSLTVQP